MEKYFFKKSYINEGINLYIIRFILYFFKYKFKPEGKVLIKACDGIGDLLVRSALMEKLMEKYGRENVVVLLKSEYLQMGEILGYKSIGYSRSERKNFFQRLKKMYKLNTMGFSTYINIEFVNDITVGNLFIPERMGIEDSTPSNRRCNRYYTKKYPKLKGESVIDVIRDMGENILKRKVSREEIIPDLRESFQGGEEGITVAVGTSSREKTCSPEKMKEYLKILLEKYPKEKIYLLGSGKNHSAYAKKLLEDIQSPNLVNMVDKTSLKEVFDLIAGSRIFIGFDSGLYNFAFTVRKPTIAFFRNTDNGFIHEVPWVKVLLPEKDIKPEEIKTDSLYSNREINSISIKSFREALNTWKEI